MRSTCVLADSTAQFPQVSFHGQDRIRILPLEYGIQGYLLKEGQDLKVNTMPALVGKEMHPFLTPPSLETIKNMLLDLGQQYDDILVLTMSADLGEIHTRILEAIEAVKGSVSITVLNTQTTSIGLGILAQRAARMIQQGESVAEIERTLRQIIPRIYTLICTTSLSYLHHAGYIDHAQAEVGEMLGTAPIFTLEEGKITPLDKVRSSRVAMEFFQEFLSEFDNLEFVAFVQNPWTQASESRMLKQFVHENFTKEIYSEHNLSPASAVLFGPRCISMVAVEK